MDFFGFTPCIFCTSNLPSRIKNNSSVVGIRSVGNFCMTTFWSILVLPVSKWTISDRGSIIKPKQHEINAIRSNRPSSFTDGINAANIAARRQAAETYGRSLPGGRSYSGAREAAYDRADLYGDILDRAADRGGFGSTANQIREIQGDLGYGPSIRYPDGRQQFTPTPTPTNPTPTPTDPTPTFETTWKPTANYDGGGYIPGQFGVGPKYKEYEKLFANSIAEGFTLEEAMKLSKTATPYDWEQAFGSADQWKKIGGGKNQGGSGRKSGKSGKSGKSMSGKKGGISGKRGQGKTRCDIRLKTDIAPLMSTEINDDLAELAFFVKELRVK